MNRWTETNKGGIWLKTADGFLARPFDRLGMNHIRFFNNLNDAVAYANTSR